MARLKHSGLIWTCGLALLFLGGQAWGGQVKLEVSAAHPAMMAGTKQVSYVKVGLTGFKMSTSEKRTPVNVALVLDKSSSMQGTKIEQAKNGAIQAIQRLDKNDIVSVITYDSTVQVLVPSTKLANKSDVIRMIEQIQADGSTALFGGVSKGSEEIRKFLDRNRVNRVILLSDGMANVGPESPSELGDLGHSLSKEGISVTTLGLGAGYNEDLMVQLAGKSDGNHMFVENARDLVTFFNREFNDVLSVVAQEIVVKIKCSDGVRPIRVLERDAEINGSEVLVKMNQLYSEQEKYIIVEVEVPAGEAGAERELSKVSVRYANMDTKTDDQLDSIASVKFTSDQEVIAKATDTQVMVACVAQISNERNRLATTLRDKGQIEEARKVLLGNATYLVANASAFNSDELKTLSTSNIEQSKMLDEGNWNMTRKGMRGSQYWVRNQQGGGITNSSPNFQDNDSIRRATFSLYTVAAGDTLQSIALKHFGNGNNETMAKIMELNPALDPNRLKIGLLVKIPDLHRKK